MSVELTFAGIPIKSMEGIPDGYLIVTDGGTLLIYNWKTGRVVYQTEKRDAVEPEAAPAVLRPLQGRQGIKADVSDVPRGREKA